MTTRRLVCVAFAFLCSCMISAAPPIERRCADDAGGASAQILENWQRRNALRDSVEVQFEGTRVDRSWGSKELLSGRVVLFWNGHALVETTESRNKVSRTTRLIWADDSMHYMVPDEKLHVVNPIAAEDRGQLPAVLALPFQWRLTGDRLKEQYRVELVKEEADVWILRFTPLTHAGRTWCLAAFVWLDRRTYLPRRYFVYSSDRKFATDYRVTTVRCDKAEEDELVCAREDDGEMVITGFSLRNPFRHD